ncbi:hypothetical protein 7t3_0350 [Salmonella phage 7t3]|nr:hypothetical protein 7t3_0350 [Salmonella phage 7t3]
MRHTHLVERESLYGETAVFVAELASTVSV